jgi:aromatic ring-opening dioxygenase LigB subunit
MPVTFACIAPHGTEIIPELAGGMLEAFVETRRGMEELAELMKQQQPETIVLATPHGLRLEANIGIVTSEFTEGMLEANGKQVRLRCQCERQFAKRILKNARKARLPVVGANYGTSEGSASCMPMDWGTLIPLWFFSEHGTNAPRVVIVTPSREIQLQNLVKFGRVIAETAEEYGKKVAFVASADQGHTHKADGPYGFNTAAKEYDDIVKHAVAENNLKTLLHLPSQFVENAKPDSLWQIAILQGILEKTLMNGRLISYEVPTYFGMLCAVYQNI